MENEWLYGFKRKIIGGLVFLLLLSTGLSMFYITIMARDYLLQSSATNTHELAGAISSSLKSLMLRRFPDEIHNSVSQLGKSQHIARIFVLNRQGRIIYSSDRADNGKQLAMTDESCRGCHSTPGTPPASTTAIFKSGNTDVQRNVTVIYNEPECYGCHPPQQRINGKLIIDCSLADTYALIGNLRMVILVSGSLCLLIILLAIPYLSRSIDRYIDQVVFKSNEISMIYTIIESVSKSIDLEDLKTITLDIVARTFASEEVTIVLPMRDNNYRVISRNSSDHEHRRLAEPGYMLSAAITRWQANELTSKEVMADRTTVYLPISRGDIPLALLEICSSTPFSAEKLRFMDSACNPIAIAFENARLYTIAITDELTGLYTVRHFRSCLDRQRELFDQHGEKFALLFIDIDNFKRVNDTYGHPVGDQVLKRVSWSIAEAIRQSDHAFRYGGEEFAVLLPKTARNGAEQVAERIRQLVAETETVIEDKQIMSTVSIGLALFPANANTLRELVVEADNSLYAAKKSGKNCVIASERVAT